MICGPGESKSRLAEAAGAEPLGRRKSPRRCGAKQMSKPKCTRHSILGALLEVEMSEKVQAAVARSAFPSQMLKASHARTTFDGSDVVLRGRCKGL